MEDQSNARVKVQEINMENVCQTSHSAALMSARNASAIPRRNQCCRLVLRLIIIPPTLSAMNRCYDVAKQKDRKVTKLQRKKFLPNTFCPESVAESRSENRQKIKIDFWSVRVHSVFRPQKWQIFPVKISAKLER